jgi:hypothetical protein
MAWRHEVLCWAAIAPHSMKKSEPPRQPPILRIRAPVEEAPDGG